VGLQVAVVQPAQVLARGAVRLRGDFGGSGQVRDGALRAERSGLPCTPCSAKLTPSRPHA
jgi:hypothetical protein